MNVSKSNQAQPGEGNMRATEPVSEFGCGRFIDLNAEIDRLQADSSIKEESGHRTKMLLKNPEFRIVLICMRASSRWDDHQTKARIFVKVLRGRIRFHTPDGTVDLSPDQLFVLDPGIVHSVDALDESAFLLTLSDPK